MPHNKVHFPKPEKDGTTNPKRTGTPAVSNSAGGNHQGKDVITSSEHPETDQAGLPPPMAPLFPSPVDVILEEVKKIHIARPKRIKSVKLTELLPNFQSKKREARLVVWTDLNYITVTQLDQAKNGQEIRNILANCLALNDYETNPKSQILLDMYFQVINHAGKMRLNCEQTSAFFSIARDVHEMAIETPVDNTKECLKHMDALFCRHIIKRPPWSARIFDVHEANLLRNFLLRTYFRHFEMYKYVFTPSVYQDVRIDYVKSATVGAQLTSREPLLQNPVLKKEVTLEDVMKEIDMEELIEKAIADGTPLPVAVPLVEAIRPSAKMTGENIATINAAVMNDTDVSAGTSEAKRSKLLELEKLVSEQMDVQLIRLREKIAEKFHQVDEMLLKNLGMRPPENDPFSLNSYIDRPAEMQTLNKHPPADIPYKDHEKNAKKRDNRKTNEH